MDFIKFQSMDCYCTNCYISQKWWNSNFLHQMFVKKEVFEKECRDNHWVSHISSVIGYYINLSLSITYILIVNAFYLQDANAEHTDTNIVLEGDIECYFSNQPCRPCTYHHAECHKMIVANNNVQKREFCGCAVNFILHEHRGTMSDLQENVLETLNLHQDNIVRAVNNYVEVKRLCWRDGHNHLTNER